MFASVREVNDRIQRLNNLKQYKSAEIICSKNLSKIYRLLTSQSLPSIGFLYNFVLFSSPAGAHTQEEHDAYLELLIALLKSYGECLIGLNQHSRAKEYLKQARELIRSIHSNKYQNHAHYRDISEMIADCYIKTKDYQNALMAFESCQDRDLSSMMELAHLHRRRGNQQEAIDLYRQVLKSEPYVLAAAEALIHMGLPEDQKFNLKKIYNSPQDEWIREWIDSCYETDQNRSTREYRALINKPFAMEDLKGILDVAYIKFLSHDCDTALELFEAASKMDEYNAYRMDVFALLLYSEQCVYSYAKRSARLSALAKTLSQNNPKSPEVNYVLSVFYAQCSNKKDIEELKRQHYDQLSFKLIDRAIEKYEKVNGVKYTEGYILKANMLLSRSRFQEAVMCYHSLHTFSKDIRIYQGFVSCYLCIPQFKDALAVAGMALRIHPSQPLSHIMYGNVLLTKQDQVKEAEALFLKALELVPSQSTFGNTYLKEKAIIGLADFYCKDQRPTEAIPLLTKQLMKRDSDSVHCKLGDVYTLMGVESYDLALSHYHTALGKNPNSVDARQGLVNLEKMLNPIDDAEEDDHLLDEDDEDDGDDLQDGLQDEIN
ncbi:anaphase-promoting complex subunit 7 [Acrasis kona]|uniref:Anaphase-promoting complex subunit 7 n=1 Tax=Acrasis kona TaxID=1008807 RepID=A0AAW2ZNU2_9EUKA